MPPQYSRLCRLPWPNLDTDGGTMAASGQKDALVAMVKSVTMQRHGRAEEMPMLCYCWLYLLTR